MVIPCKPDERRGLWMRAPSQPKDFCRPRSQAATLMHVCELPSGTKEPAMSEAIANLQAAQGRAIASRPRVGGFPYLAETLRSSGVTRNVWQLPACQSLYLTELGAVIQQGTPLASGNFDVPRFDQHALATALRTDQAGESSFPQFLSAIWHAGVIRYDVDLVERFVTYYGAEGESYVERYPAVTLQAPLMTGSQDHRESRTRIVSPFRKLRSS